jgi:hypothetical protein
MSAESQRPHAQHGQYPTRRRSSLAPAGTNKDESRRESASGSSGRPSARRTVLLTRSACGIDRRGLPEPRGLLGERTYGSASRGSWRTKNPQEQAQSRHAGSDSTLSFLTRAIAVDSSGRRGWGSQPASLEPVEVIEALHRGFADLSAGWPTGAIARRTMHTTQPNIEGRRLSPEDVRKVAPALEAYTQERLSGDVWKRPGLTPRDARAARCHRVRRSR